jgi:hypothetical protein
MLTNLAIRHAKGDNITFSADRWAGLFLCASRARVSNVERKLPFGEEANR